MKSLSDTLLIEKNKLASSYPWVALIQFNFSSETLYLVANTDAVTYNGQEYTPFHLEVELPADEADPDVPECTVRAANQSRAFQQIVEASDGGVDSSVTITLVNTNNLTEDYSQLSWSYNIMQIICDNEYAHMTCSLYSPMDKRFPPDRFYGLTCRYKIFKGAECRASVPYDTCDRSYDTCESYNNLSNFGGFPGLFDSNVAFLFSKKV